MNKYIQLAKSRLTNTLHTHNSHSKNTLTDISHSEVMDILSSDRRRWVLQVLASKEPGETVHLSDLAEEVAAIEYDCDPTELSSDQRKRIYISLSQQHLVAMSGIIDYNQDRQIITPTETAALIWSAYTAFRSELNC
jgi:hypothetical protein